MFVEITNIGISPIRVDGEIKKRRNNLGMFAPDIAMYALSCSNHYANMNVVIGNIKRRPENEWQFYKEFVLSAVCGRKHRNSVFEDLRNFAKIGGYEEEFEIEDDKPKVYFDDECGIKVITSYERFCEALENEEKNIYARLLSDNDVLLEDLNGVKEISLYNSFSLAFSGSRCVLPEVIRLHQKKSTLEFMDCDMSNVEKLEYESQSYIGVFSIDNVSNKLDFSKVSEFRASKSDFADFEILDLSGAKKVEMAQVSGLPKIIDVSNADCVIIGSSSLKGVEEIRLKDGVDLRFGLGTTKYLTSVPVISTKDFPENLDVSKCSHINFSFCDVSKIKKLEFRKGATVNLTGTKGLPEVLDLSMCEMCYMFGAELSKVKNIIFKNQAQHDMFMKRKNYAGTITYVEDVNLNKALMRGRDVCGD